MDDYDKRLESFKYWPGSENVEKLALIGFYFTGYSDKIVCHYCKLDLYNFMGGEDSVKDHKRYSPKCPFLDRTNASSNYIGTSFLSPRTVSSNYPPLVPHTGDYSLSEHRLNSFFNFPRCLKRLASDMCSAGFYYTNVGDSVCCYACSIIVKDWKIDDDVWKVHRDLNPRCPLVCARRISPSSVRSEARIVSENSAPSAPVLNYLDHYTLPKCIKCKSQPIDSVLVPCFHFAACSECAVVCTACPACHAFTGGFFVVKIPAETLNLVEYGS
ncbi:IAP-5 [Plodia interpunctella granulovirus]|uniref:IAP-5 n=1 Tax=Plodia interpunctella granulovirus TaxID=262175 RepID=A0A1L5JGS6_9BBAC|nr:IAP-5 [Plodia interpunctella granulovirus]APO13985.1 IAP-5 [Plodia interpunctella granulovirus]